MRGSVWCDHSFPVYFCAFLCRTCLSCTVRDRNSSSSFNQNSRHIPVWRVEVEEGGGGGGVGRVQSSPVVPWPSGVCPPDCGSTGVMAELTAVNDWWSSQARTSSCLCSSWECMWWEVQYSPCSQLTLAEMDIAMLSCSQHKPVSETLCEMDFRVVNITGGAACATTVAP